MISLWVINGSSFLAIKVAIDTIPPLLSAGLRFSIAGAILFTIYFLQVNRPRLWEHHDLELSQKIHDEGQQVRSSVKVPRERITLHQWKDSLLLGVTLFLGGQGLLTWGAQYLSSGMTGLLNSTIPLWVAIISYVIYRWFKRDTSAKKMSRATVLGLVAGFGGLMLLVGPSIGSGDLDPIGTAALIISSISWAIGSIYSTKARLPVSILASAGMIMITGGLMLTSVSFLFGEYRDLDLMQISVQSIIAQIYLIGIITIVGFTDFYWLLRVTSASLANTFAYVSPVIAVLLGVVVLHENITLITIIAMVIILSGVALMVTKKKAPSKSKQIQSS
ncbi:MAG TPA: EamA family transporter [Candidatus Nitrosocosmicus sp.]|nr:EamA family transporter [Candidatus Nitrosocosmicus sp.]